MIKKVTRIFDKCINCHFCTDKHIKEITGYHIIYVCRKFGYRKIDGKDLVTFPDWCKLEDETVLDFTKLGMKILKTGMTELEFKKWKEDWYRRIPKCDKFVCCHELMSCGIKIFCGDCSIYGTYTKDKDPKECQTVGCEDCMLKYECEEPNVQRLKNDGYDNGDNL